MCEGLVRTGAFALILCSWLVLTSCGSNGSSDPKQSLSGNWLFTLNRVANPAPLTYSGFLVQTGTTVAGSLMLGDGCEGVGPVNGTAQGQDLELDINELGQNLNLTGTFRPADAGGIASATGQFSKVSGGCSFQSTGNWSAVQIPPLTGSFHGSIGSAGGPQLPVNVNGNMQQGPNIGSSNATLVGTITLTVSSSQHFCTIPNPISMNGLISGTTVSFLFYDQDGSPLASTRQTGTVTPDGTSLTSTITFPGVLNTACPFPITQTLQITFP